ncbi:thiamine-phosphate kinase [Nocardia yamanashiensis]|uniref:thiamine-phosphate kinase n=1 Tax=Nocardia yamanashiensis TaxID=209247 RepID=UPI001E5FBECA|nr:thiamine-phosphate kinase [Nocardia yamanashiensis]UGT42043.1 thiamine-phosphate kinase [Nocardia yamanashiensis]
MTGEKSGARGARTVAEVGEFALIARINAGRPLSSGVLLGPGDDAAVVAAPTGRFVVTTDMLVQDRHFRLDWSSAVDIGRKAIAQNAADVVAMGARPSAFVVGLGCPSETAAEFVEGLADGMWAEIARSGGAIAGGDMVRSPYVTISVTAFGDPYREPILRSGARPGDVVAVAGRLGWAGAGFAVLSAGFVDATAAAAIASNGPSGVAASGTTGAAGDASPERDALALDAVDAGLIADVLAAHRVPRPPYEAVLGLPGDAPITALTDVSDGLLADLGHIAESSRVAIDLDSGALRDPALEPLAAALGADPLDWILAGGEDHAFAATFAGNGDLPAGWVPIGRVVEGAGVTLDGTPRIGPTGWESFA